MRPASFASDANMEPETMTSERIVALLENIQTTYSTEREEHSAMAEAIKYVRLLADLKANQEKQAKWCRPADAPRNTNLYAEPT